MMAGKINLRFSVRWQLLAGSAVAVTALGATLGGAARAAAPSAFSPGWYAQRSAQTGTAAAGTPAPIGITAAQQQQINASRANLTRAADALRSVRTLQSAAQAASAAAGFVRSDNRVVTDGLGKSGLYFARGAAAGDSYDVTTAAARAGAASANGLVWQGAELPTQKANTDITGGTTTTGSGTTATTTPNGELVEVAASGNTLVTVKQTAAKAILTWQNFDVGAHTTLYFNQTSADGTPQRNWVALNRVLAGAPDASGARVQAAPSLILGKIRGEGEIYVINQNGVIFGGSSQVNVNSIVASSLDVGLPFQTLAERNNYFLTNTSGRNNFSFQYLLETDPEKIRLYGRLKLNLDDDADSVVTTPTRVGNRTVTRRSYAATIAEDAVEGGVTVEAGGQIVTGTLAANGTPLGLFSANTNISRIVLAGPTVTNAGTVRSDDGQAILVGARNFSLYANDGLSGKPIDPNGRGALVEAGQQDLTSVAVGSAAGAARPNPFINRSLAETIFGNYAIGTPVPAGAPKAIIGVAQGGENYDRDQLNSAGFPELDENKKFELQFDSRKRPFIVVPTFWNEAGLATTYAGTVTNTGLVSTPRGSVVLRANTITQSGVLHATTSVNQAGLIDIKASNVSSVTLTGGDGFLLPTRQNQLGSVTFSTGAVTAILPDDQLQADGTQKTIPSDALSLAAFKPSVVVISTENSAVLTSADRLADLSLTDLDRQIGNFGLTSTSAGGQITANDGAVLFAAGSLLEVPSGNITVTSAAPVELLTKDSYTTVDGKIAVPDAGGGVVVLPASITAGITVAGDVVGQDGTVTAGAVIDASGLTDVVLAMASNLIVVARVGQNELADSPLQRDGFIYRQKNILVDRRLSGVRDDGFAWVGTPLFDASGYVNARGQLVTERMLTGGNIVFGGAVVTGRNSLLNVAGGLLTYAAGSVATSQLITADGRRTVDIGRADPLVAYAGFAGQFTEDHSKWNVTTTYSGLSLANATSQYEASYIEGSSAGKISFAGVAQSVPATQAATTQTTTPAIGKALAALDGRILGGAVTGPYQRQGSAYNKPAPRGGTLDLSQVLVDTVTIADGIDIAARRNAAPDDFLPATVGGAVASGVFLNHYWSTEALADSGLADLVFGTTGFARTTLGFDLSAGATSRISIGADANPLAGAKAFGATTLALPDGASLRLNASDVIVAGDIVAHAGSVTAALISKRLSDADVLAIAATINPGDSQYQPTTADLPRSSFVLGVGKTIDLSGNFVNDINATRDSLVGYDFVNGGVLTISTTSILNTVDFRAGSTIDLSSGGYVTAAGRLGTTGSAGLGRGRGGNLSIELSRLARGYVPLSPSTDPKLVDGVDVADIREQIDSNLILLGSIDAFGFQGGGTFTLIAPEIVIGDGANGAVTGLATLTPGLFTDHGFGSFALTALLTARIDDGVTLALNQQQFMPTDQIATATTLADASVLGRYAATSLQRTPVNLSLTALGQTDFNTHGTAELDANNITVVIPKGPSFTADNALTLGAGATIVGDPLAQITLSATGQMRLGVDGQGGGITAAGGTITIRQRFGVLSGGGSFVYGASDPLTEATYPTPSYETGLIASGFAIDAGGVLLADLRVSDHRAGTIVAGGTVILDGGSEDSNGVATGAILGRSGSTIDVAGASGVIDLPADGLVRGFTPTTVASAGGTLRLDGATLKSTLGGAGGNATSAGATLDVGATRAVQSVGIDVDGIQPLAAPVALDGTTTVSQGALVADNLLGNGFDALVVRGGLTFYDSVAIDLKRSVILTSGSLNWATARTGDPLPGRAAVRIAAPYLRLQTTGTAVRPLALIPTGSSDTLPRADLLLSARTIDLSDQHAITGFATATLAASGDLRFVPQLVTRAPTGAAATAISTFYDYAPTLAASGDLILSAAQVYPSTGVSATISARFKDGLASSGANTGTITVLGNANSAGTVAPLSAGGSLTLDAGHIVQNGVLRAPLGQINLGVTGGGTQSVELMPGSLTSVAASSTPVPYGTTVNGSSWFYANLSGSPLTALPAKAINIRSASAALDQGATLDLSGGGDVYATEFIPGLGGQRNVLTTSLSTDTRAAVYAILPGQQPLVAPVDPNGYSNLVADVPGQTLTLLSDAGGLKAGTYTLYAGSYATLPGAYRVQAAPATTDIAGGTNATLPDGSVVVAGQLGLAGTPYTASRTAGYRVFDHAAWSQYSQVETVLGTKFFTAQATAAGVAPAPLPADAGRLSIAVSAVDKALRTLATFNFGIATGGRGGQVDLAASKIAVVSASLQAGLADELDGYLVLTPGDVRGFNAASVLLGATRLTDIGGDALTPVANQIRIATTAGDALANPELLFVTTGGPGNAANGITVDAGSVVTASGAFSGQPAGTIRFGQTGRTDVSGNALPDLVGDGNVVRLSNGGPVKIVRLAANPAPMGLIDIRSTAANPTRLDGGKALQLDSSNGLRIDGTTLLGGRAIDLSGDQLRFADTSTGDAVIDPAALALLAGAQQLTLRARSRIIFDTPTSIAAAAGATRIASLTLDAPVIVANGLAGGAVSLDAAAIVIGNTSALPLSAANVTEVGRTGDAHFQTHSNTLVLTGKDRVFQGFGSFGFDAATSVALGTDKAKGTMALPGDVTFTTPLLILADGSDQILAIGGTLASLRPAGASAAAPTTAIGGKLTLDVAGNVRIDNTVSAVAGILDVRSRTGDIVLANGGMLSAKGFTQLFSDKEIIVAGGSITLAADTGNVAFETGSSVSVAADPRGNAGSLGISIGATGALALNGSLAGGSGGGGTLGGSFDLYSNGAVALEPLVQTLVAGGFAGGVAVRSGLGNLELTATSLTVRTVTLTADDRSAGGGLVNVATTIDASGPDGGTISLYGQRGVTLASTAVLRAVATAAAVEDRGGRGGSVAIGTGVLSADDVVQNEGGVVNLAAGSRIDVSDAIVNGVSTYSATRGSGGASVSIRAPIIAGDVAVTLGSTITGARTVSLEAYQRFTTGNSAFDGIIDPAGWFNADGSYVAGTWTDAYGGIVKAGLGQTGVGELTEASYFAPITYDPTTGAATNHANQAHVAFYQQTLVDFVQNPGIDPTKFAGVAGLHIQPGIELVNSDTAVNGGGIAVLSNWNLGAGTAADALTYRTAAGAEPGVLTLRAVGDIAVKASISDGFFSTARYNPYSAFDYRDARLIYQSIHDAGSYPIIGPPDFPIRFGQKIGDVLKPEVNQYYHNYDYFADRVFTAWNDVTATTGKNPAAVGIVPFPTNIVDPATNYQAYTVGYQAYLDSSIDAYNAAQALRGDNAHYRRPVPPAAAPDEATYPSYVANYFAFLAKIVDYNKRYSAIGQQLTAAPTRPLLPPGVIDTQAVRDFNVQVVNTIANNATAGDPLPIASSDLMTSGTSWSYRLVAGSDTGSARPDARLAADVTVAGSGNLALGNTVLTAATATGSGDVIRTGTGSITIAVAGDVRWINGNDTIYTAGIDNGFVAGFVDTSKVARVEFQPFTSDGLNTVTNEEIASGEAQTKGVFGKGGGDISIVAGGSLVGASERGAVLSGFRDPVFANNPSGYDGVDGPFNAEGGFYLTDSGARRDTSAWLFVQGVSSDQPGLFGQFGGTSTRALESGLPLDIPSLQSAEWVRTGRFAGTVATLGGGNIRLDAGSDVSDVSVSLVSTLQASGGKSAGDPVAVTHFGGGDLAVHAGGNISGATVLVGRGNASIVADGALVQPLQSVLAFDPGQFGEANADADGNPRITDLREPIPADLRAASLFATDVVIENRFSVENGALSIVARNSVAVAPLNPIVATDLSFDEVPGADTARFAVPQAAAPFSQLGTLSSIDIRSVTGTLDYAPVPASLNATDRGSTNPITPTLTLAAIRGDLNINGGLELAPSPTGNLDLLASGSIFYNYHLAYGGSVAVGLVDPAGGPAIHMDDRAQSQIATVEHPQSGGGTPLPDSFGLHSPTAQPLHFGDTVASHIVALSGDLTTGSGTAINPVAGIASGAVTSIVLAEAAVILAGNDIVDMRFTGQNANAGDITSITAGRDITYTLIGATTPGGATTSEAAGGTYTIGGQGTLALVAGRNLSLAPSLPRRLVATTAVGATGTAVVAGVTQGVLAVGNDINPYLPAKSADLELLFGVGPSVTQPGNAGVTAFVDAYVNPANAGVLATDYGQALLDFINVRLVRAAQDLDPATSFAGIASRPPGQRPDPAKADPVAVAAAYALFETLTPVEQRALVDRIFFSELRAISQTSDLAQYLNYPRAYAAIDTLFPAKAGYTDNFSVLDASGQPKVGTDGKPLLPALSHTGNFDMVHSLVQTSFGSGVTLLGPGGNAVLGGLSVGTGSGASQGILTLRGGSIDIFTDGNLTVNNSRIFTLQGGDETIFATNGNIDAGRGKRTASFLPPLVVSYLPTTSAVVNFGGLVSGAGIGTLQTLPGSAVADIYLLAPRGDIDAGDAGIRSSGNLSIVANQVINGDNLTVKGSTTGVPQAPTVSATAVATASNVSKAAGDNETTAAQRPLDQQSIVTVQVTGCSDEDLADGRCAKP